MRKFFLAVTSNAISLAGAVLTTVSAILMLSLAGIQATGFEGGPYLGILTYLLLPSVFVLGLVLIPVGHYVERRRLAHAGEDRRVRLFPTIDLNNERTRQAVLVFFVLTTVNIVLLAVASYNAVAVMDSTEFCGETCHKVMRPEYTAYKRSPHSRVECVECHIGSGASWFVKSKLSGTWQLISVTFDLYERPIPTPVHNLRPARDTCEQCHWPTKYVGDRLEVRTHYAEDEANTEKKTVLLLRVGGLQGRESRGIHWHVDPGVKITYTSDEKRQVIDEVTLTRPDGTTRTFRYQGGEPLEGVEAFTRREMDCVDCHNRPTHVYQVPGDAVDLAILNGEIDRTLPYIKREGLKAIQAGYDSHEAAEAGIARAIRSFYEENYPEVAASRREAIDAAIAGLVHIYEGNVFPEMNITWGTYPSNLGHWNSPGCFRCHDGKHETEDGEAISQGCNTCHSLLAMQQENPEILTRLNP